MNLDDLKSEWKQYNADLAERSWDDLATRVAKRSSWFERTIWRRDLIETTVGLLVAGFFVWFAVTRPELSTTARIGVVIIAVGCGEVIVVLNWNRVRDAVRHDVSLSDFCAHEITRVSRQIALLQRVNWWYTGPPMLGVMVFVYGVLESLPGFPRKFFYIFLAIMYFMVGVVSWMVYRINQRAVQDELIPLREELTEIYESLVGNDETTGDAEDEQ